MKNIILIICSAIFFLANQLSAQANLFENIFSEPQIIDMKATPVKKCECNNKAVVPISLPNDSKGWFYRVTFAPRNKNLNNKQELLEEIMKLNSKVSFEDIDDNLRPFKTNRNGNIYILRGKEYADSFSQCGFFYHHGKYIGSKSKAGFVENTDGETFYIGIERNPDIKGLKIKVEVVAVI